MTMHSFKVLDRSQNIRQNYLLEASAGTGKTFSIENIVVRLIIEDDPLSIEQILVVTFTRAATRDLKVRIHDNIMESIAILKSANDGLLDHFSKTPDYIMKIIEEGEESIRNALRNLERAICSFDMAQIYTIHSFCAQMLTENLFECDYNFVQSEGVQSIGVQKLRSVIRDFFRGGTLSKDYSKAQLKQLIKLFSGDVSGLEKSILDVVSKGIEIERQPGFHELLQSFNETMKNLKREHKFTSNNVFEDFLMLAPHYKDNCDRKGALKPEKIERIRNFTKLFEKDIWDGNDLEWLIEDQLYILTLLDDKKLKARAPSESGLSLNIPSMKDIIKKHLLKYVSANSIFSRMARDSQKVLRKFKEREESLGYDDFLTAMRNALDKPEFRFKISSKYKAAIIDEFQDTDPLQWEIFHKLFLDHPSTSCCMYLVGDPKQSIYAFRHADIYTYFSAADHIGAENSFSLDTNYRSQPSLVTALNILFSEDSCPNMLSLPKNGLAMKYPSVNSPENFRNREFSDNFGAVHFMIAEDTRKKGNPLENVETDYFFPFMAAEIKKLVEKENFLFNQISILVADRYQAKRVCDYLRAWNISAATQKASNLSESPAFFAMREFLVAALNPKDESAMKIALGGKIIRWDHEEVKTLENPILLERILYHFFILREDLLLNGFACFFQKLLQSIWKEDGLSVIERLLLEEGGEEFMQDLQQVADLLLEREHQYRNSPEALIKYLDEIHSLPKGDEEIAKKLSDPTKNAVQIMTLHSSKGLEFDIVFALGLVVRKKSSEMMIPIESGKLKMLSPVVDESSEGYRNFCEELDAEKIRQLYVAMTRAKFRLYNPILYDPKEGDIEFGSASPMDLFLARLGQMPAEISGVYDRIRSYDIRTFTDFIDHLQGTASISYTKLNDTPIPLSRYDKKEQLIIIPPPQVIIPGVDRYMQSFTTLSSSMTKHKKMEISEAEPPRDFSEESKTPHTLPSGRETGNLLHHLLEIVPFEICKEMDSPDVLGNHIRSHISGTEYEDWLPVISEIIFNAVKTPLEGTFALCDIQSADCYKENEFLYESFLNQSPGYIKGFVDLFFSYQGKYYLLDWKSNWLGPGVENYDRPSLQKAMEENGYFLQANLYCEAIRKYLKLVDKRPFQEIFGGVYYLFLRGINRDAADGNGIFHFFIEE